LVALFVLPHTLKDYWCGSINRIHNKNEGSYDVFNIGKELEAKGGGGDLFVIIVFSYVVASRTFHHHRFGL
jgi:hypothetical protein